MHLLLPPPRTSGGDPTHRHGWPEWHAHVSKLPPSCARTAGRSSCSFAPPRWPPAKPLSCGPSHWVPPVLLLRGSSQLPSIWPAAVPASPRSRWPRGRGYRDGTARQGPATSTPRGHGRPLSIDSSCSASSLCTCVHIMTLLASLFFLAVDATGL